MKILERVLVVVLAVVMVIAGLNKIVSSEFRDLLADNLNVPSWFIVLVGIFEIFLAIALVVPRLRIAGGLGVFVTMVGAVIFNALGETVDDTNPRTAIPINIVLALVGLVTAWLAAGRPRDFGSLLSTARSQLTGDADTAITGPAPDAAT